MKKQLFKKIKCEVSHRELWECQFTFFFHCKLYNDLLIFTPKNCIKVFYSKITLNVPLYVSQLFTVYSKETFC